MAPNTWIRWVLPALALVALGVSTQSAQAQITEGGYYNDLQAYFVAQGTSSGREDTGWVLHVTGEYDSDHIPSHSQFQYVLKKGNHELQRLICDDTRVHQRAGGYEIPEGQLGDMSIDNCSAGDHRLTEVGDMTIEVYVVNGMDDTRTLVRTHAIQVRRFTQVAAASGYYIAMNGELTSSVIHECSRDLCVSGVRPNSEPSLGIIFWTAPVASNGVDTEQSAHSAMTANNSDIQLRCSVDGTRIDIGGDPSIGYFQHHGVGVRHSSGEGRQGERFDYTFQQLTASLPISLNTEGGMPSGWVHLSEHDGAWECSLRLQANNFRTFRFQAAGGHVVPTHPEEVAGAVHFRPYAHALDMSIAADSNVDTRVSNVDAARGPFFGVGWQTDAGRAMGAALPTIGEAHLPSEGGPRGAARGRRGRHGRHGRH